MSASRPDSQEVTEMVISAKEHSAKKPTKQSVAEDTPKPIKINGATHFDFEG